MNTSITTDPMFEIRSETIRGVETRVWAAAPASLLDVWEAAAAHGDAPFLVYEDEVISHGDAHRRVESIAAGLADRFGVQQGDRVAIAARNYPEWALSFWAVIRLGAVAVPLNAWWTGPELAYALRHSGARLVLADDERLERLAPEADALDLSAMVGIRTGAAGVVPFEEVEAAGADAPVPRPDIDPDDDATILYTSGTTGPPRARSAPTTTRCRSCGTASTCAGPPTRRPAPTRPPRRPLCSRSRSSTWAGSSPTCSPTRWPAANWCSSTGGTPTWPWI